MNRLRASLYEHIVAAHWRLIDQGFVHVADSSDGCKSVSVHGNCQFPAIFSFSPGQSMFRNGSWVQWSQKIEGRTATFALRFASLSDTDEFGGLLPHPSIVSRTPGDRFESSEHVKVGASMQKHEILGEINGGTRQHLLVDCNRADDCSPTRSEEAHVPAFILNICALSHDLQCVALTSQPLRVVHEF